VPLVIRSCGGHVPYGGGTDQSEMPEARFLNLPGLKVVVPTTPEDAKGLLKSAIRDDNPVLFLEHKQLYVTKGPVPEEEYLTPIGRAVVRRPGRHLTVAASGLMVPRSLAAAAEVSADGIEAEVIDLRTIKPLDSDTVVASVKRTSRLLTVEEGYRSAGLGAEVAARVAEEALEYLESPIRRLAVPDVPIADNGTLSDFVIPTVPRIARAMRDLVRA
jgi:pyruvate/2-oxoglutarate/acetoin dehydrogenase E1 component